jgi:exopolysaccharide biosynthesis polyprenyl glycosylphosphotransferase
MKGLYRKPRTAGLLDYAGTIVSSTTTGTALVIVLSIIYRPIYSRLIYAFAWAAIVLLLVASRGVLVGVQRWRWNRGDGRERVLVVGGTGLGRQVMDVVVAQTQLGYNLVGYLDDRDPPASERRDGHFRHLGAVQALESIVRSHPIDQVIIALPFWEHHRLPEIVAVCRAAGLEFRVVPDLFELSFDRVNVANLSGIPLIGLKELSLKGWNLVLKRAIDLALILVATPVVLLLVGVIALAVKLDSTGPAIFKQLRIGKGGRPFTTYKFRTMVVDAEERRAELAALNEADGPIFKIRDDPRKTRMGRLLRRSSMDELPQLWNIVRGEMSLVGPRPQLPQEVAQYEPWHYRRLEVKPGLTGLWQVLGRSDTSFDEMVRLDIYYAENWSPSMDLRIMLETIPAVLSGKGAY